MHVTYIHKQEHQTEPRHSFFSFEDRKQTECLNEMQIVTIWGFGVCWIFFL